MKIDAIFAGGETGLDVSQQIFALGCQLLKSSTPSVDLFIAGALRTPGASLAEASSAAKRARDTVSALVHRIGGETAHSTAAVGLIGAYTTVQELAVFTQDPYLTVLATALGQLRFGRYILGSLPRRFQCIQRRAQAKCSGSGPSQSP